MPMLFVGLSAFA